ncbi:MAG: 1-(5-phosphoribosyl)-5-[(5-phosphoribosylamino)methylideneamino]imidazole-4-carboxamide isomerase [Clostridiales bacterium]|mgnify:CR=1 FL=1|jgi:phosphoribosylformimino-5-aminoimidazole carboxamide ribotide isomerase|nr:1-(5-phosphoribosyl)-5-[(5-phosphoribosylamino)methylideneamino]imidazole-4-carboxamide isomerase [Clostridiales bacterium]HOK82365.1 1-(5-phosphoribosyl)-5-[(5-phosphoribosylamino)methylideneamino]imidazole-4-carboxamide isomerase [Clostridia bacterium]HOL61477.1 1-(5-phosphoribosyl)-5-[(5-phosphoribosylamino)methylideneamino]imidazole-4-carboxamide isomerase [Clostridia bacterium]HPO54109.1 1-(5-phosphoribosyl)-5-[(5-phosphoribosylamino)methylideneamino]imidazole-4-carboxamide isomerase [Cl
MEIFPAIDILDGKAVRLTRGDYNQSEVFAQNPVEVLKAFKEKGAANLHVVDLDGARDGTLANFPTIEALAKEGGVFIQVGGGIRDEDRIKKYLDLGAGRVILGTVAVTNFDFAAKMAARYKGKIAVGVDAKGGLAATEGWKNVTQINSFEFCARLAGAGINTVIYTDIATDGAMAGTNLGAFERLKEIKDLNVIASGGISSEEEIKTLRDMGVYGAILGKALYKGKIDLGRAVRIGKGEL